MRLSYADKLKLAEQIRATAPLKARLEPEYRAYLDRVTVEDALLETCEGTTHIYILRPTTLAADAPLIINFHGGGFCIGHHERDLVFAAKMAVETKGVAIDVDYKLAPEYSYPVAIHEGYDVARWCFENAATLGCDPRKVVAIGHSAGASIVAAICLKANESGDFRLALHVLDYPATDFSNAKETGLKQETGRSAAFRTLYTDDIEELIRSPFVSPVFATHRQLRGLPDALVLTADRDPLHVEGELYASLMTDAGVRVITERFADSGHGFVIYGNGRRDEAHDLILKTISTTIGSNH